MRYPVAPAFRALKTVSESSKEVQIKNWVNLHFGLDSIIHSIPFLPGKFISVKIEKENLMQSNAPNSIAAGIVFYIAHLCNLNVSKSDVNNVSEISEVTINKCYKTLEKMTSKLIPPVIIRKYNIQV